MSTHNSLFGGLIALLCLTSCNQRGGGYDNKEEESLTQSSSNSADTFVTPDQTSNVNTEDYDNIVENQFLSASRNPLSTFSLDVDHAAYSNVRRFIQHGSLPPKGAVRIEEMVNYFPYEYPAPVNDKPFNVLTELGACPWNRQHQLLHIGIKGREINTADLPAANIVFLVDVSGSMEDANKLPLVKESMKLLTTQLREKDKVAIVVYAGNAGLVLPSTSGSSKFSINSAIDNMEAGGSTAGAAGIELAYKIAKENFVVGGNNRIILATDGDFNVGTTSDDELVQLVEEERKTNIFLTVLGYGMGNYKDNKMQQLADKGNGNHAYIDDINEAKKTLVNEFGATLFTIAKDVKLQIEFNPAKVASYRLIGYENRKLANEDFNNDTKDAGELGVGHTVTALYEIIPLGNHDDAHAGEIDALRYQSGLTLTKEGDNEMLTIKLRFKEPGDDKSDLIVKTVDKPGRLPINNSTDFRFSAAVAEFGMLLRNSAYKNDVTYQDIIEMAQEAKGIDREGYRTDFVNLVRKAALIPGR